MMDMAPAAKESPGISEAIEIVEGAKGVLAMMAEQLEGADARTASMLHAVVASLGCAVAVLDEVWDAA